MVDLKNLRSLAELRPLNEVLSEIDEEHRASVREQYGDDVADFLTMCEAIQSTLEEACLKLYGQPEATLEDTNELKFKCAVLLHQRWLQTKAVEARSPSESELIIRAINIDLIIRSKTYDKSGKNISSDDIIEMFPVSITAGDGADERTAIQVVARRPHSLAFCISESGDLSEKLVWRPEAPELLKSGEKRPTHTATKSFQDTLDRSTLIQYLQDAQAEKGMTQVEFSEYLGINRSMLTKAYAGGATMDALAEYLRRSGYVIRCGPERTASEPRNTAEP